MKPIPRLLSKTKLMRGYRCLKSIYLTVHQPYLEAPITPELQALFDQGNAVTEKAREYFPGGSLIDNPPYDFGGAIRRTQTLIQAGATTIYEAAFEYMGCYARADILQYSAESKRWSIYEVKSTTKVKPEHIDDVGLQTWIIAKTGLLLENIYIMYLNRECHYPNLSNLFVSQCVTQEMRDNYLNVPVKIKEIKQALMEATSLDLPIGEYCTSPTECGFKAHCFKNLPEFSILNLPGLKDRKWELYHQGIIDIQDQRLTELNELQTRIIEAHKTGQRFINKEVIQTALATWQYPLVYLDFETINPAIPRYNGCSPYSQVPFQFSVHLEEHPQAELKHFAFLHDQASDPRPDLIPALLQACGKHGSIVAYYSKFEGDRIQELAEQFPEYAKDLLALIDRIVDPLPIIKEAIYDVKFQGSFSLKKVAPGLLGDNHSYEGMAVANGSDAQRAYETYISGKLSPKEKDDLRQAMLDYCNKDTMVMVDLVHWLADT